MCVFVCWNEMLMVKVYSSSNDLYWTMLCVYYIFFFNFFFMNSKKIFNFMQWEKIHVSHTIILTDSFRMMTTKIVSPFGLIPFPTAK